MARDDIFSGCVACYRYVATAGLIRDNAVDSYGVLHLEVVRRGHPGRQRAVNIAAEIKTPSGSDKVERSVLTKAVLASCCNSSSGSGS